VVRNLTRISRQLLPAEGCFFEDQVAFRLSLQKRLGKGFARLVDEALQKNESILES
jgi:hypothetical protein